MKGYIMRHSFFILVLSFSEDDKMTSQPQVFNLWYIIFEVVSAYGGVGMSIGIPGQPYSMAGGFGAIGKLAIIATFIMGKCRGLPKKDDIVIDFQHRQFQQLAAKASKARNERVGERFRRALATFNSPNIISPAFYRQTSARAYSFFSSSRSPPPAAAQEAAVTVPVQDAVVSESWKIEVERKGKECSLAALQQQEQQKQHPQPSADCEETT
jgi:hypothetical protein